MKFAKVERDFVERTVAILDQYDEYVITAEEKPQQYEVTLLINCLLGLVVLPYEHRKRMAASGGATGHDLYYPEIFSGDNELIDTLLTWGLKNTTFSKLKIDGIERLRDDLTLRELIALVRHSIAHSRFSDGARSKKTTGISVNYQTAEYDPIESVILSVHFVNHYGRLVDFEASFPVAVLRSFAYLTAKSFLKGERVDELRMQKD